jgi:hypothetical protein
MYAIYVFDTLYCCALCLCCALACKHTTQPDNLQPPALRHAHAVPGFRATQVKASKQHAALGLGKFGKKVRRYKGISYMRAGDVRGSSYLLVIDIIFAYDENMKPLYVPFVHELACWPAPAQASRAGHHPPHIKGQWPQRGSAWSSYDALEGGRGGEGEGRGGWAGGGGSAASMLILRTACAAILIIVSCETL